MSENCVFCHVLYFSFLSHFGLIFLYGVRMCSSFIDFHAEVQPSQHHLLKRLSFPNCIHSLLIYQRLIVHRCVSLFLSFLFCPLIHMPVFMPILCCFDSCSFVILSGVQEGKPALFLSLRIALAILGLLLASYKFQDYLFYFCEKMSWGF